MTKKLSFLISIILSLYSFSSTANEERWKWKKAFEKNGLSIFKAEKHSSGLIPIKFETVLKYPPSRVLSVIFDTDRKSEWIPKLKQAQIISKKSKLDLLEYSVYNLPWPFTNRSFLVKIISEKNPINKSLLMKVNSVSSPKKPPNQKNVRGFTYNGDVLVKRTKKGHTFLQVKLLNDFKGNMPTWLINVLQMGWPKEMMRNFKQQIRKKNIVLDESFLELD